MVSTPEPVFRETVISLGESSMTERKIGSDKEAPDIVERLEECLTDEWCCLEYETANRIAEAIDEIKRLRCRLAMRDSLIVGLGSVF